MGAVEVKLRLVNWKPISIWYWSLCTRRETGRAMGMLPVWVRSCIRPSSKETWATNSFLLLMSPLNTTATKYGILTKLTREAGPRSTCRPIFSPVITLRCDPASHEPTTRVRLARAIRWVMSWSVPEYW